MDAGKKESSFLSGGGYEKWLGRLGVSDAPLTRRGLATALMYFHCYLPSLSRDLQLSFLKGMDLHKTVRVITLDPPTVIAAFRKLHEYPFRLFYTKAGVSIADLGLNPRGRYFARFRLKSRVNVLESRCASAVDTWTDASHPYVASGGGIQYVIPESCRCLEWLP